MSELVRKRKAILSLGFFEERWKTLEGFFGLEEDSNAARLKRDRSSSSSSRGMGMEVWRGGSIRGARKKMIGIERRREKVSTNGVEYIEVEEILREGRN